MCHPVDSVSIKDLAYSCQNSYNQITWLGTPLYEVKQGYFEWGNSYIISAATLLTGKPSNKPRERL